MNEVTVMLVRARLLRDETEIARLRAVLRRIADADHQEDGGPACNHAEIAEEALRTPGIRLMPSDDSFALKSAKIGDRCR